MIVKFARPGCSFKGVVQYLMHDAGHALSAERVAWTHTLGLAHDDPLEAMAEMRSTAANADALKAAHGIGGRKVAQPVRHLSLNWHPREEPDQGAMIGAAKQFLKHMGWQDHQTILVAHTDKAYRHVHLVVNAIHPETGRKLDDSFERRRAQAWALAYEQEQGEIFCKERLKPVTERAGAAPRPIWQTLQDSGVETVPAAERLSPQDNRRLAERHEWQLLRDLQQAERIAFFERGREIYRAIHRTVYRELREELRPEWASYYAARRDGLSAPALAALRTELIERQHSLLQERRDDAIGEQRQWRDQAYRELLDRQKVERGLLAGWQDLGVRTHHLLARRYPMQQQGEPGLAAPVLAAPVDAGSKVDPALDRFGVRRGRDQTVTPLPARAASARSQPFPAVQRADPAIGDPVGGALSGFAGGLLGLLGGLSDSLIGGHSERPRPPPNPEALNRFAVQRGRPPPEEEPVRKARERERMDAEWYAWWASRRGEPER